MERAAHTKQQKVASGGMYTETTKKALYKEAKRMLLYSNSDTENEVREYLTHTYGTEFAEVFNAMRLFVNNITTYDRLELSVVDAYRTISAYDPEVTGRGVLVFENESELDNDLVEFINSANTQNVPVTLCHPTADPYEVGLALLNNDIIVFRTATDLSDHRLKSALCLVAAASTYKTFDIHCAVHTPPSTWIASVVDRPDPLGLQTNYWLEKAEDVASNYVTWHAWNFDTTLLVDNTSIMANARKKIKKHYGRI
jgi:hypothetical protein